MVSNQDPDGHKVDYKLQWILWLDTLLRLRIDHNVASIYITMADEQLSKNTIGAIGETYAQSVFLYGFVKNLNKSVKVRGYLFQHEKEIETYT